MTAALAGEVYRWANVQGAALDVLLALAALADEDGMARTTLSEIGRRTGLSRRLVALTLEYLAKRGEITGELDDGKVVAKVELR